MPARIDRYCLAAGLPTIPSPHLTARPGPILIPMAKSVTREQAERKKSQAAAFMERIGESDRADEFDDMCVDEYAEHRGLQIANPTRKAGKTMVGSMSRATGNCRSSDCPE
jgi:hypothetical protein